MKLLDAFEKQLAYSTSRDVTSFVESRGLYLRASTFKDWRERREAAKLSPETALCSPLDYWDHQITDF